ncbi:hypothetical protein E2C01_043261 [Portunus trituberculatus]|uniref:Uncharacterized protein n=1 Tax=Portunus trituberculatus TaxID=210409 RepID=A0A5B7FVU7_PORTR|nr:hypothetical protein [Portunus trituberculatus]
MLEWDKGHGIPPRLYWEGNDLRRTLWKAMPSKGRSPELFAALNHRPPILLNSLSLTHATVLFDKLDKKTDPPGSLGADFSQFPDFSPSEDEAAGVSQCLPEPDPLTTLIHSPVHSQQVILWLILDTAFQKAFDELVGHFHGEEETENPLSECLAGILNASLQHWPSSDGMILTCDKIKLPGNLPNLKVLVTNPAIIKAMSVGRKLVDT